MIDCPLCGKSYAISYYRKHINEIHKKKEAKEQIESNFVSRDIPDIDFSQYSDHADPVIIQTESIHHDRDLSQLCN